MPAPPPPPPASPTLLEDRGPRTGVSAADIIPELRVGTGISDITGPVAEVGMMGYGNGANVGLHTRLYARAFVFADAADKRVVFVSADLAMIFSSVKQGVLKRLAKLDGGYNDRNVMISATHTHSGPGGYSHHMMYNFTTGGHIRQNYDAIVDGISEAIIQAHNRLAPAAVTLKEGDIVERASVNRSTPAYTLNPEAAGANALVPWTPAMTVLGIRRGEQPVGAISWFAVHNTTLTNKNYLVSSDHKGYAAYLFERKHGSIAPLRRYGDFVAAFPNGAEGDLTPNIGPNFTGPHPENNQFGNMEIIGDREFRTADQLFSSAGQTPVRGAIDFRHSFVRMPGLTVASAHTNGALGKSLCKAAYGASFMAGSTEDGPTGMLREGLAIGATMDAAGLEAVRRPMILTVMMLMPALAPLVFNSFVSPDAAADDVCHAPKPILIPTGRLDFTPDILPFQLLRIGPVVIAGIPGEMTVTAGRRLQARLMGILAPTGVQRVILSGLSNEYSAYITTPEEYPSQQYEGASTLFGRLTFDAYLQEFVKLATAMATAPIAPNEAVAASQEEPPDLSGLQRELQTGVLYDEVLTGEFFGQVLIDAPAAASRGDLVKVTFRGAHPKNDLKRNDSYLRVERDVGGGRFDDLVAWDSMPETAYYWHRTPTGVAVSAVEIHWVIPADAAPGNYRITHSGKWKSQGGNLADYTGTSRTFTVR
jgi:neutral ceramidase